MGKKAAAGTPKALSNRMRSRGLQKLKWYCQMCEKQCRDENGFKCHTQSEGHMRQMGVFKSNAGKYMHEFSRSFESSFLQILSRHNDALVDANTIYREVISDKQHVHMNATAWSTLSGFVAYLGETGRCHVEESDKGWNIRYIDRNNTDYIRKKRRLEKQDLSMKSESALKQLEIARARKAEEALDATSISIPIEEKVEESALQGITMKIVKSNKKRSKLVSRKRKHT